MIEIARVTSTSSVAPQVFFDRWCDLDTHPQWAPGMEYFRLDDPFGVGARGTLKLVEGRISPFEVTAVGPGFLYEDATELDGARLLVRHEATTLGTGSALELVATVDGERAHHFAEEFAGIDTALAADLASLIALVEGEAA